MQYPSKRATFNVGVPPLDFAITMVEYGYDTVMIFPDNISVETVEAIDPLLSIYEEYGIPVLLACQSEIGGDVPTGTVHPGWTISNYEAAYGDAYDLVEADSRVIGYFTETPTYVGSQWLAGRTSKLMMYDYTCCTESWPNFANIISLYDEVVDEAFVPSWATTDFPAVIPTLHSIKPTLKIGVWDQTENLYATDWSSYWTEEPWALAPPPLSYATQQTRALAAFTAINAAMVSTFGHKLDFNVVQYGGVDLHMVNQTFASVTEWHDARHLTYPPTGAINKPVQQMTQKGHIPAYGGASICTYPATSPLVDSFANTGNERIMLKNAGSGCRTHAVTVTGTSATENYTLAIQPDRATFLGPFPVATFGTLPTISYDNTNLYISIIKDAPYGA